MIGLRTLFRKAALALGLVAVAHGSALAGCNADGTICTSTGTNGSSASSAAASVGPITSSGGAGGTGGTAIVNNESGTKWGPFLAAGLLGSLWGGNHSAPVAASGDLLHKSLGTSGFDFWLYSGRNANGTAYDEDAANYMAVIKAADMIPLGPQHAVIGYEALAQVSPAVKAALNSATAPQGDESRSALIGYFDTAAAAAPSGGVARLPAADGQGTCNVYIEQARGVTPSYRVAGKAIRGGGGSRAVALSPGATAPASCALAP